jgi:oligopeptide transport system substrate-binding protein
VRVTRLANWGVLSLVVLGFALPCSPSRAAAAPAQVLNIGNGAEPKDLDPHVVTGVPEHHILQNLFEPLVSKDPKTLQPVPGVAESWTLDKSGKVYTFKLRANAKWSNGEPVTAEDFVYSWTRLLQPETASEYAYQAYYIVNGEAFNKGTLKDASQLGMKAIDKNTLQVTLNSPTPFFLGLLYHHSLYPVHKGTIEKHKQAWTRKENIVTNGAFLLDSWQINKVISLKKNPNYWDAARVTLTTANFLPVEKQDTEEKMFRSGELHVTNEVPLEKITTWKAKKDGVYQEQPYLGVYHYWFNTTKKPLDDKRVRKALALAIDRERLVTFVTKGGQLPATTFTPPGTGGYKANPKLPKGTERLDEAKKLLTEAGYPGGKGLPPIELLYNTSDSHKKIAEAIQQMWKQNLGVEIKLYNQEWKVYLDSQTQLNYQISRAGWIADYNDPNTFLDMFLTGGGNNRSGWSNKTYDKYIADAGKEQNAKKRHDLFRKAEDILLDELPCMPIYIYTRVYLKSPLVEGWHSNVEDIHPLKYVSLKLKP